MKIQRGLSIAAVALTSSLSVHAGGEDPTGSFETETVSEHTPLMTVTQSAGSLIPTGNKAEPMLLQTAGAQLNESLWSTRVAAAGPMPATVTLEIELRTNASEASKQLAKLARDAWASNDQEAADQYIHQLSQTGDLVATGRANHSPASSARSLGDARIGGDRLDPVSSELEFDTASGNLFALNNWGDRWTLSMSANGGMTWSATYQWNTTGAVIDVDMVVVDGFVYVTYAGTRTPTDARLRRFNTLGEVDSDFGFRVVHTTPVLNSVTELVLEGNTDSNDNRIYLAVMETDNTISFYWDSSADGTTFTEDSPNVVNAASSMDMHWNDGFDLYAIFLVYRSTTDNVVVWRWDSPIWESAETITQTINSRPATVTAQDDVVVVAYGRDRSDGTNTSSTVYEISYDGGDTFLYGGTSFVNENSPNTHAGADVSARLGYGLGYVLAAEEGSFDPVRFRYRDSYVQMLWDPAISPVNTVDTFTGPALALQAIPTQSSGATYAYGVIHAGQLPGFEIAPHFARIEDCRWLGDVNNTGSVEIEDLLLVLREFGENGPDGDTDGNDLVDIEDLLRVLREFGQTCVTF